MSPKAFSTKKYTFKEMWISLPINTCVVKWVSIYRYIYIMYN